MKLWLLQPRDDLSPKDDPWDPWYDKCFGHVIRAESEINARYIAHTHACDENRGEFLGEVTAYTKEPWMRPKYSTCIELLPDGKEEHIMRDVSSS